MRNPLGIIVALLALSIATASAQESQPLEPSVQASKIRKQSSFDTDQTVSVSLGAVLRKTPSTIEVRSTLQDSVAQRAGLEIGDRIVSLNGKPVREVSKIEDAITNGGISDRLILVVEREDELAMVDLNAPKKPAPKLLSISNLTPAALAALEGKGKPSTASDATSVTGTTAPARSSPRPVIQRVSFQQTVPATQSKLVFAAADQTPAQVTPIVTSPRTIASSAQPTAQAAPVQVVRPASSTQRSYTPSQQTQQAVSRARARQIRTFRRRPRRNIR